MEGRHFDAATLKALIRWDITWSEFWGEDGFDLDFTAERYKPDLEDVEALLSNIRKRNPKMETLFYEWTQIFDFKILTPPQLLDPDGPDPEEPDMICNHYDIQGGMSYQLHEGDEDKAVSSLFQAIADLTRNQEYLEKEACSGIIDFSRMLKDIASFKKGDFSHIQYGWKWTDEQKLSAFSVLYDNAFGPLITEDEYPEARVVLDEMCERRIAAALDRRAYDCYGGDKLYPCDWKLSRNSLLTLMDLPDVSEERKGFYANTLGYIYYYGRCTDNVPDYETALKYYMVGGSVGVYQSIYKISDMLRGGKGVPRNITAANNIVEWSYEKIRSGFLENEDPSSFPDVALRLSSIEKDKGNFLDAYRLLLEADYVMQNRLEYGYYGDEHVAMSIRKGLEELRRSHGKEIAEYNPNELIFQPIGDLLHTSSPVRGVRLESEDGKTRIIFFCNYESPSIFVEFIATDYVNVMKEVCYEFDDVEKLHIARNGKTFLFDSISVDSDEDHEKQHIVFKRDEHVTCEILSGNVSICLPLPEDEKEDDTVHHFASCSFTEEGRTYDYLVDGMDVKVGDKAIVDSWDGEAEVFIQDVFDMRVDELPIPFEKYKKLKRLL